MTGHLVLTTLHTNDAASSALRLISMGVDSFLVATALTAVLAQRLVKRICDKCKIKYTPTVAEDAWIKPVLGEVYNNAVFQIGRGCSYCNSTGYKGRIGIYELLEFDQHMIRALQANNTIEFFEAVAANKEYKALGLTALDLAAKGITTISETFRVMGQITDAISRGFGHAK
jgi:MSHA biogenesis protein MshE